MDRFWDNVSVQLEGCWDWVGWKNNGGYGSYPGYRDGKSMRISAHRSSYEMHNGLIPRGMFVLHTCDNPACVRPDHLRLGTQTDNMRDCAKKGRTNQGERMWKSVLTDATARRALELSKTHSHADVARMLNVERPVISYLCEGKTWKHIPRE